MRVLRHEPGDRLVALFSSEHPGGLFEGKARRGGQLGVVEEAAEVVPAFEPLVVEFAPGGDALQLERLAGGLLQALFAKARQRSRLAPAHVAVVGGQAQQQPLAAVEPAARHLERLSERQLVAKNTKGGNAHGRADGRVNVEG
ncbi:MAG: hypothetical protein BRD29_02570 [Bacteroidetes bacterium QH_2_67_10]|nr:MAG: hypothetical protein BRD29_02570 [Bacteroidetes bacterium QH_2_67_10]